MLHYNKHADLNERIRTPVTNYKAVSHYRACLTMQGRAVVLKRFRCQTTYEAMCGYVYRPPQCGSRF